MSTGGRNPFRVATNNPLRVCAAPSPRVAEYSNWAERCNPYGVEATGVEATGVETLN